MLRVLVGYSLGEGCRLLAVVPPRGVYDNSGSPSLVVSYNKTSVAVVDLYYCVLNSMPYASCLASCSLVLFTDVPKSGVVLLYLYLHLCTSQYLSISMGFALPLYKEGVVFVVWSVFDVFVVLNCL